MDEPVASGGGKDLQDLRNLPRSAVLSYLQKQSQPDGPRSDPLVKDPEKRPILSAFSPTQVATWLWQYISHRIGPRHPFQTYTAGDADQGVYPLEGDDEIRIAIAGDWGTGTDEAQSVATRMEEFAPHYAIHLGDIYYVGDRQEVAENFLGINNPDNGFTPCKWPAASRGRFALNGNHEMYARGIAYFRDMLPQLGLCAGGKALGQKASFFCLENDHWRIIALDTGYDSLGWPILENFIQPSCALRSEQIDWLRTVVKPRNDDPRGIILLTHHQYYSAYDDWYTAQGKQLAEFFPTRPVLWFWGHEHRMTVYREFGVPDGVRAFGRCIGHGGMPVDLPPRQPRHPACKAEFADARLYSNSENLIVGYNGFARMTLRGAEARVEYVDLKGTVVFTETWVVDAGTLRRHEVWSLPGANVGDAREAF